MNFVSDFSLFPIKQLGKPGWEYRKATWASDIDPLIHKLFDSEINVVKYDRVKLRDGSLQHCKVEKNHDDEIIMYPGDGYNFLVRKDTTNNKLVEQNNNDIPHDMLCLICMDNKRTHVIVPCMHLVCCSKCSNDIFNKLNECPICRGKFDSTPKKIFF